jgi:pimeloyl-ACP methyl ester carboxylesterase
MSAIILDGSMVHYEALGRGRPIIFLHGWVGSWRYWVNAMQIASTSFRAYALDLFGFGDSMHDPLLYSLDRQVDLLKRFLEEMGIGKVALVGHNLGAVVGFSYLKQRPQSVDRVMAVNYPFEHASISARMRTADMPDLVDWLAGRNPEAATSLSDASKVDPQALSASLAGIQANGDMFADIRGLGIPCLFVSGPNDPAIPMPSQDRIDSFPDHIHHISLEGTGHFPMIDNPNQFNRLLTDFLALDSGLSPRALQLKEEWKRRMR